MKQKIEVRALPTVADLRARRLELARASIRERLLAGHLDEVRVVVDSLAQEFDIVDVASASIELLLAAGAPDKDPRVLEPGAGPAGRSRCSSDARPPEGAAAPRRLRGRQPALHRSGPQRRHPACRSRGGDHRRSGHRFGRARGDRDRRSLLDRRGPHPPDGLDHHRPAQHDDPQEEGRRSPGSAPLRSSRRDGIASRGPGATVLGARNPPLNGGAPSACVLRYMLCRDGGLTMFGRLVSGRRRGKRPASSEPSVARRGWPSSERDEVGPGEREGGEAPVAPAVALAAWASRRRGSKPTSRRCASCRKTTGQAEPHCDDSARAGGAVLPPEPAAEAIAIVRDAIKAADANGVRDRLTAKLFYLAAGIESQSSRVEDALNDRFGAGLPCWTSWRVREGRDLVRLRESLGAVLTVAGRYREARAELEEAIGSPAERSLRVI